MPLTTLAFLALAVTPSAHAQFMSWQSTFIDHGSVDTVDVEHYAAKDWLVVVGNAYDSELDPDTYFHGTGPWLFFPPRSYYDEPEQTPHVMLMSKDLTTSHGAAVFWGRDEQARDGAVGPDGSVYVVGMRTVSKLSADLSTLLWTHDTGLAATQFHDGLQGVAIGDDGVVYVVGRANINDGFETLGHPAGSPPIDDTIEGWSDAFVRALDASDGTMVYSTFLGGEGADYLYDVEVADDGGVWVAGHTDIPDFATFIEIDDPDPASAEREDVLVARLTPYAKEDRTRLSHAYYYGGGNPERGKAMALHPLKQSCTSDKDVMEVYVTGDSGGIHYPVIAAEKGVEPLSVFGWAAPVARIAFPCDGKSEPIMMYSVEVGGTDGVSYGRDIEVDERGRAHLVGTTSSDDFPLVGALEEELLGATDAFYSVVDLHGGALDLSLYLGGDDDGSWSVGTSGFCCTGDHGLGLTLDKEEVPYVTGYSYDEELYSFSGAHLETPVSEADDIHGFVARPIDLLEACVVLFEAVLFGDSSAADGLAPPLLSDPEPFYGLRDEVMVKSEFGTYYIDLYEEHSPRVVTLLALDPDLSYRVGELFFEQLSPGLVSLVAGDDTQKVTPEIVDNTTTLLKELREADLELGGKALSEDIDAELDRLALDSVTHLTFTHAWEKLSTETKLPE